MLVSIIIANWNGRHLLPGCLDALRLQTRPPDEVLIVDNASTDDSIPFISQEYPWATVLPLPRNLGLAGATNAGIARSRGDILVTLNNDTIPEPTWLAALCAPFAHDARLGSTMSTMLFAHAPTRIASAGLAVHRNGLVLDDLLGASHGELAAQPRPIFGPSAGAAAYRRAMLEDTGAFDEDFFMYLEDADLAWRGRLRGWDSLHVPDAATLHIYSASSGQGSPLKQYHLARNRLWCLRKNLPTELAWQHWREIVGYDLGALAYATLRGQRAGLRGRYDGLRGAQIATRRRTIQSRRTETTANLDRWLLPSPGIAALLRLQREVNQLSSPG
jgi:GT2 family glycosyltransferase